MEQISFIIATLKMNEGIVIDNFFYFLLSLLQRKEYECGIFHLHKKELFVELDFKDKEILFVL